MPQKNEYIVQINYFEQFHSMLHYAKIRNFKASEVLYLGNSHNNPRSDLFGKNSYPPVSLWFNILPTLKIVDDLRDYFSKRVFLTNIYRDNIYNQLIDGASGSSHNLFNAIDFVVEDVKPIEAFELLVDWRKNEKFKGGIGSYDSFTHVDTRGTNATWSA